jgi:hemolysin III
MRNIVANNKSYSDYIREPGSALSHLVGIVLSFIGLIIMMFETIPSGNITYIAGGLIFGISMISLYSASTIYHWSTGSDEKISKLRKIDHAMIFILIAGTYTPVCLISFKPPLGYILLGIIWSLCISGLILKINFMNIPRWFYTGVYVALGWIIIIFVYPLYLTTGLVPVLLLFFGGVLYTIGAVIYALKPSKLKFGGLNFHEIFHIFILLGTLLHFLMISIYVL